MMMMLRPLLTGFALAALPLVGCSDKPGASITFNASDDNGAVAVSDNGQTGEVALNVPGFSGKLNDAGFKLHAQGSGLTGTSESGQPFTLELHPDGDGHARGTIIAS
jgi:hypothetical protein